MHQLTGCCILVRTTTIPSRCRSLRDRSDLLRTPPIHSLFLLLQSKLTPYAVSLSSLLFPTDPFVVVSDPESDSPSIAFSRLIHRYTRSFVHSDPLEALQYLYLICLNGDLPGGNRGKKEVEVAHELVRELVMDTRQYSSLLGDVRNDGTKIVSLSLSLSLFLSL